MFMKLALASTGDTLIIRHGRSRVRHSSEKSHIRWGLQAFDNLTLYDYDYESSNGTNGSNETLFDLGFNQTLFGTDAFGYLSSEVTLNANSSSGSASNSNGTTTEWRSSSTRPPNSPPTKKRLAKKQIMESIRKNVEEGIEYLRTHAHLAHPTAVMPSERALLRLQNQQFETKIESAIVNNRGERIEAHKSLSLSSAATRTTTPSSSYTPSSQLVLISKLMNAPQLSSFDRDGK